VFEFKSVISVGSSLFGRHDVGWGSLSKHFDFIVIGAGVAGLSAAYFLSKSSSVAILERESHAGMHSSGRSAAVFIESYENYTVSDLTMDSKGFLLDPPKGFSNHDLMRRRGGLSLVGEGEEKLADEFLKSWSSRCPSLKMIDMDEVLSRVPVIKSEAFSHGIFDPELYDIDVNELLSGFSKSIRQNEGGFFFDFSLEHLGFDGKQWLLSGGKQSITGTIIINAAGAWANEIAALAGVEPSPLVPCRRTALTVQSDASSRSWPMVHTFSKGLYFKPEAGDLLISPQDETESGPIDAFPEEFDIATAVDRFENICDHSVKRIKRSWAGLRTLAPDRMPVVGPSNNNQQFIWLAGQGGFGVQTSPALGRLTAGILLNGERIPDAINVSRFVNNGLKF
jgi:D-arginine dehydrogenase